MQRKFYLDTAIWRDYFEDRSDGIRPLGEFAFQFLKGCRRQGLNLLYSEATIRELRKDYSGDEIKQLFSPFEGLLVMAGISNEQYSASKALAQARRCTHEADILHAILARDNHAALITRDGHFECLRDIAEIKKPEEVIFD